MHKAIMPRHSQLSDWTIPPVVPTPHKWPSVGCQVQGQNATAACAGELETSRGMQDASPAVVTRFQVPIEAFTPKTYSLTPMALESRQHTLVGRSSG